MYAWGHNGEGQLGIPDTNMATPQKMRVYLLSYYNLTGRYVVMVNTKDISSISRDLFVFIQGNMSSVNLYWVFLWL